MTATLLRLQLDVKPQKRTCEAAVQQARHDRPQPVRAFRVRIVPALRVQRHALVPGQHRALWARLWSVLARCGRHRVCPYQRIVIRHIVPAILHQPQSQHEHKRRQGL